MNRHKDTVRWKALALEYEMKIRYLERALAQEESKLRIAEQASSLLILKHPIFYVAHLAATRAGADK